MKTHVVSFHFSILYFWKNLIAKLITDMIHFTKELWNWHRRTIDKIITMVWLRISSYTGRHLAISPLKKTPSRECGKVCNLICIRTVLWIKFSLPRRIRNGSNCRSTAVLSHAELEILVCLSQLITCSKGSLLLFCRCYPQIQNHSSHSGWSCSGSKDHYTMHI